MYKIEKLKEVIMKKIWIFLKEKVLSKIDFKKIKDILYTKKEVEHSERFNKAMDILNNYSFIFHALLSMVVVFLVEFASRWDIVESFEFITKSPLVFFYNSFIVFASLTLVYLFRRRGFARVLICSFWIILGIINGIVLSNRVTPFGFADLAVVSDLMSMIKTYVSPLMAVLIIIGVSLFIFVCSIIYAKGPIYKGKQRRIVSLISILAIVFMVIPFVTSIAQERNVVASYFTNIAQGYKDYGFVYAFSSGVVDRGMSKPDNYDEAVIAALQEAVASEKAITTVTSENGPNIITVLLESFVDPYEYNFMSYSKDPTPFFHYLEDNFSSGYLITPVVGAGTANAEFEILTGMKLQYFGTGEYPYKTILKETDCESIAAVMKSLGYGTHAVHNNGGKFYSRDNAFSMMGFDTFTSKEMMDITDFTPTEDWAEDSILAEEMVKTLTCTENQPDFTYGITVGSHGVYPEEEILENPYCEVYGLETVEETNKWTYYMHQINKTDQFMQELCTSLNALDEDTIVVFWGDHLPTMGLEDSDMVSGDIYKTKYVTWNNFGLEEDDKDLYAYQLMSDILNTVGVHEGTMVTYHQTQADNEYQTYIDGIEMLQYDILYGDRYCYENGQTPYPPTKIVMGIDRIYINDMYLSKEVKNRVVIEGSGFTQWSRVFVNGEKVGTEYVSGTELMISTTRIKPGDEVIVKQLGAKSAVFSSSNSWFYIADTTQPIITVPREELPNGPTRETY